MASLRLRHAPTTACTMAHSNISVPLSVPLTRTVAYHHYAQFSQKIQDALLRDVLPHSLSKSEVDAIHHDTLGRIRQIRELEAFVDAHPGAPEALDVENKLFLARVKFRLLFCRTFRVNDLPVEVLANIFRFVAWSSVSPATGVYARLSLTWVCRRWREVAIADSTLWNAIWFREPPPFCRSFEWFRRAESAPLDIRINDTQDYLFDGPTMADLLDRILFKMHQIRVFIVIVEGAEAAQTVFEKLRTIGTRIPPTILERLELHHSGAKDHDAIHIPSMPLFGGAHMPSLKYVSLNGVHLDWQHSRLANLTTLDIRRMPFRTSPDLLLFRSMIASCPNLWKLCLDNAGPQFDIKQSAALDPISLPNLKILVYSEFSLGYAMYVAGQIHAPNVRDLTLVNFIGEDYTPLFVFMTTRFPHVRILTVYSTEVVSSPHMVKWLTSMPEIVYLRIANIQLNFLTFFLQRSDPPPTQQCENSNPLSQVVCPNLSVLDLQKVDPAQAIAWIAHRQKLGCPIKKIYLSHELSTKMTEAQHKRMAELALLFRLEQGVKTPEEDWLLL